MAEVIVIQGNQLLQEDKPKLRVCAYARVSSKSDEQQYSFFGQVQHYTRLINENPEWEYVDIYADDYVIIGISGKNPIKSRVLGTCPCYFFAGTRYIPLKVKIRQKKGRDNQ